MKGRSQRASRRERSVFFREEEERQSGTDMSVPNNSITRNASFLSFSVYVCVCLCVCVISRVSCIYFIKYIHIKYILLIFSYAYFIQHTFNHTVFCHYCPLLSISLIIDSFQLSLSLTQYHSLLSFVLYVPVAYSL